MSQENKEAFGQADGHDNQKTWSAFKAYFKQQLLDSAFFAAAELTAVMNFIILVMLGLGASEFLYWTSQGLLAHAMADMGWLVKGVKYLLFTLAAMQLIKRAVHHLFDKQH